MKYYQVRQYSRFCKSDISVTRFEPSKKLKKNITAFANSDMVLNYQKSQYLSNPSSRPPTSA